MATNHSYYPPSKNKAMANSRHHLKVENHVSQLSFDQSLESLANFVLGFLDKTLTYDPIALANCTYFGFNQVAMFQMTEMHLHNERWIPSFVEIYNMMENTDPIAKACVPVYIDTYVRSNQYEDTFDDERRVMFNIVYRMGNVYSQAFEVDFYYRLMFHDNPREAEEFKPQLFADYLVGFKQLGQACGTQFKNIFSSKTDDGGELYLYPDSLFEIEDPVFDEMVFPGPNYDPYPTFITL